MNPSVAGLDTKAPARAVTHGGGVAERLFEGTDFRRLSGTEIREALLQAVAGELEECARLADDLADRLSRSGKPDAGMVAIELAAKIRARKPA